MKQHIQAVSKQILQNAITTPNDKNNIPNAIFTVATDANVDPKKLARAYLAAQHLASKS